MKNLYRHVSSAHETWHGQNGRIDLVLECGHTQRRKYSQGAPSKARCLECEAVREGGGSTQYDRNGNTRHWQTWDSAKGMPINHSAPMTPEEIVKWRFDPLDSSVLSTKEKS